MIEGRRLAVEDKDPHADYSAEFSDMFLRLRQWAQAFTPEDIKDWCFSDRAFISAKIPVAQWLVTPPIASREAYMRCAQNVIDAAAYIAENLPAERGYARVTAIIDYPDMFGSEVCVFLDRACWESLPIRDAEDYSWTPMPESRRLSEDLGLVLPAGTTEQGWITRMYDDLLEPPETLNETWIFCVTRG